METAHDLLRLADSVWCASTPVRFAGAWFPHVMTVIRLENGSLLVHSPCRPSTALLEEINRLGVVTDVVAPNWFHDLYLLEYRRSYPEATFWGPRFLQKLKGRRLIDRCLDEGAPWSGEMPHLTVRGLLAFDESLFYHIASRTLVAADLFMNLASTPQTPAFTRFAYRTFGVESKLAIFPLLRLDPTSLPALRCAAARLIEWPIERIIVGHGTPIETNASARLEEALLWLHK